MLSKEAATERKTLGIKNRTFMCDWGVEEGVGQEEVQGTGRSSRNRAELAMFWCDSQRKVSVYQHMSSSKASHGSRISDSHCTFASKEWYHGIRASRILRVNSCN